MKLEKEITKSELIESISNRQRHLGMKDIELSVKSLLDCIVLSLSQGNRVEVRGFGSFSLHHRKPRIGRNPKTGVSVSLLSKYTPHFKPGRELRERVNKKFFGT